MFGFILDRTVKITDLLTSISIIFAALTLAYTWTKDRRLRRREYADRVRSAAALTLSKVERYQALLLSIGRLAQAPITEADELIVKTRDKVLCRDTFWKSMHAIRSNILQGIQDEDIETAYSPLYIYRKDVYDKFNTTIAAVMELEDKSFWKLQEDCQKAILRVDVAQLESALTGNKLRGIVIEHGEKYSKSLREALSELKDFLQQAVTGGDETILRAQKIK